MSVLTQQAAPRLDQSRGRRLLVPALSVVGVAGFLTVTHVVDPTQPGNYPTCRWMLLTGTWCPGCGTLRATHALTEGQVGVAFGYNPLTVLAYVVIFVGFLGYSVRQWTGRPKRHLAPAWVLYALFWGIIAFWVLRNVPGWTWLSPA